MIFDSQSSKDLEFDTVCAILSTYCKSQKAKDNAQRITFFENQTLLEDEFNLLVEIQKIYQDERYSFPHPNAEDIDNALNILRVENGVLILSELLKVYALCIGTKQLINFAYKHREESPLLYAACVHITGITDVLKIITDVLDEKQFDIKNDATPRLAEIRSQQKSNRLAINKNFDAALKRCKNDNYLAESEETFISDRRLLSVLSQYKKQVKGRAFGVSAKGTYTYIEPEENAQLNRAQEQLRMDETNELYLILEEVTYQLRSEKKQLKAFQRLLIRFDLLNAKVLFAASYNGIKPIINKTRKLSWQNAKHPLLYLKNQIEAIETIGQDIDLDPHKRFLVISGPNAGGKSITLKTVGLIQMMFQSGLFLSIDERSQCCWFEQVLSDIGDNQSIENQLSTYSYRLNRMQYFLQHANENTLLLLDEFGSGSDPELGGALAEVFYEELYTKNVFAVITTHYTNIKILTATLPEATNACMLFDTKKLTPLYQLSVGQPGSSFTFEVAQHNGISVDLIERAKGLVSENKVKVEGLTVALQQEKSKFKRINDEQYKSNTKALRAVNEYEKKLDKLTDKAERQNLFFEQQNKFITTGKKVFELLKKFKHHKTDKGLTEALRKLVAIEKNKIQESEKPVVFDTNLKLPNLPVQKNRTDIETLTPKKVAIESIKIGDLVKIRNQAKKATVTEIKGKKLTVQLGNFTIKTTVDELEAF